MYLAQGKSCCRSAERISEGLYVILVVVRGYPIPLVWLFAAAWCIIRLGDFEMNSNGMTAGAFSFSIWLAVMLLTVDNEV